ncbi:gluconokinase [Terrabacter terrigena]|uniref:Gluconokinase n=1 Tax=Terrabacter terrigena TaxID=574718 RepID=A0ABW3MWJ3_9MICO
MSSNLQHHPPPLVVVMGVSGSGKTTVGAALAQRLRVPFADADDFHPRANIDKMSAGIPLTDDDRGPWLEIIGNWLASHADTGGVVSCSALRRAYRDVLTAAAPQAYFIHLHGTPEVIAARVAGRPGHFMPAALVESQFATLEPLQADERGSVLEVDQPVDEVVTQSLDVLQNAPGADPSPLDSHSNPDNPRDPEETLR